MRAHRQSSCATVRREEESKRRQEEQKYFHIDVKRRDETNRDVCTRVGSEGKCWQSKICKRYWGWVIKCLGFARFGKCFTELGICAAYPFVATQLPEPKLIHYGISAVLNGVSRYSQAT